MTLFLFFILFVISLLVVLMYTRKIKMPSYEGYVNDNDIQVSSDFAKFQNIFFHDVAPTNKGIPVNPTLITDDINDTLAQPDLYLPKSPDRDYKRFFTENPEDKFIDADKLCKKAIQPKDLPKHMGQLLECGWYYLDDPSIPSFSQLGTVNEPIFPDKLPPNGTWYWNLEAAQGMEEIKFCKRIKQCAMIDLDGVKGKCGFSKSKGYAVPIFPNGREKYRDENGALSGGPIIIDGSQCIAPNPNAVDPICGSLGYPSPDNSYRLYTQPECDRLGGTLNDYDECYDNTTGSSYSDYCKGLNNIKTVEGFENIDNGVNTTYPDVCTPNASGNLTIQCLKSLAKGIGFSEEGALIDIMNSKGITTDDQSTAVQTLNQSGINVPNSILGDGNIDSLTAGNLYNNIYTAMLNNSSDAVKAAAKFLVNGDGDYDSCNPDYSTEGKIPLVCLQREFRKTGCQASGSAYPTKDNEPISILPISEVTSTFQNLRANMNSSSPDIQYKAVSDCLGIQYPEVEQ